MYNPPQAKKDDFDLGRLSLKKARNFTYATAFMAAITVGTAFVMTVRTLQNRDREASHATLVRTRHQNQRVVVVGAGAGGAALAGFLTATAPHLCVTVIEKDRKQTFHALEPHAHVGHRSYDLNTTGAYDSLRSPASWNVSRDAQLVMGEVVRVDTAAKEVLVKPARGHATARQRQSKKAKPTEVHAVAPAHPAVKGGEDAGASSSAHAKKKNWFQENVPFHMFSSTAVEVDPNREDADGCIVRPDGLVAYAYDVLVLASGAERGVTGPLARIFPVDQLDRHLVAVNPGVTRDNLGQLYEGNVLHVKIPPAPLFELYEQQRLRRASTVAHGQTSTRTARLVGTAQHPLRIPSLEELDALATAAASPAVHGVDAKGERGHAGGVAEALTAAQDAVLTLAQLSTVTTRGSTETDGRLPTTWPYSRVALPSLVSREAAFTMPMFSCFSDVHAARPLDSVFVSTTNLIWKYMTHFNKFHRCQLITVTADADPLGPAAPPIVNDVVRRFWASRQAHTPHSGQHNGESGAAAIALHAEMPDRMSETSEDESRRVAALQQAYSRRFHFLANTYVTHVDYAARTATLYNHRDDVYVTVPYRLLVVDLPLIAPRFITASGLARGQAPSRRRSATERRRWWYWSAASEKDNFAEQKGQDGTCEASRAAALSPFTSHRKPSSYDACLDEDSFPDVDPRTLQHLRFPDIFALGDIAGVPSMKSYGATLTQVPVVAHNVTQVLYNQKREKQRDTAEKTSAAMVKHESKNEAAQKAETADVLTSRPREVNAHYDGYTSFHIIMTPWRALWPECVYSDDLNAVLNDTRRPSTDDSSSSSPMTSSVTAAEASASEESPFLRHVDHHLYSNVSWSGLGGFLNGAFIQTSLYENAYFFLFSRGVWYPPRWFRTIRFDVEDGSEKVQGLL